MLAMSKASLYTGHLGYAAIFFIWSITLASLFAAGENAIQTDIGWNRKLLKLNGTYIQYVPKIRCNYLISILTELQYYIFHYPQI